MKKKRILVLTDHMPWGHRSIARAIYGFLKTKENSAKQNINIEVEYAEAKMPVSVLNDLYVFMYRYLPLSNKFANKIMENESLRNVFIEMTDNNLPPVQKVIDKYKPDLIISTYFLHSHSLARWREKENKSFDLWTVVSDPWTINPIMFVNEADLHLVYDEVSETVAMRYGIKKNNILRTGWWVRPEMYNYELRITNNINKLKNKMGIGELERVVFFGGGSLGTNAITKFLPVLLLVKQKCTIIFNTGTDKIIQNRDRHLRLSIFNFNINILFCRIFFCL